MKLRLMPGQNTAPANRGGRRLAGAETLLVNAQPLLVIQPTHYVIPEYRAITVSAQQMVDDALAHPGAHCLQLPVWHVHGMTDPLLVVHAPVGDCAITVVLIFEHRYVSMLVVVTGSLLDYR